MDPILLFRREVVSKYERKFAKKHLRVEESRVLCRGAIVVGRYSILPFYDELDRDLNLIGSRLINTPDEHRWITSFDYYSAVREFTPRTWDDDNIHTCDHPGPFVVKGKMSSKKHRWKSLMFADSKRRALALADELKEDSEIREQGVVYREYVPLRTYEIGPHELPQTNEWRFFFLGDKLLGHGYYWSLSDCARNATLAPAGIQLAQSVARRVSQHATFYTLDVAETADGRWLLIEINDGQMAGPCEVDLDTLYGNLKQELTSVQAMA